MNAQEVTDKIRKLLATSQMEVGDLLDPMIYLTGDIMAQASGWEHDVRLAMDTATGLLAAYRFHCSGTTVPDTVSFH